MGYDIYSRGNLENKKWIGLTYDYAMMIENLTQADCLGCLTEFELVWLQANVQYMRWSSRWTNCPCTPQELNDMADVLERKLMSCIEINPYQTDYIYNQAVSDQLGTFNADYTGLPSSVNPNAPDDFFSGNGSSDRITGLCDACKVYVYSYSSNWVQKARIILGAVFVVTFFASIALLGGVIAGTVLAGLALITQAALDAMEDEQALDDIVCCMFNAMTGTVINQANFEASLDACGFTVGSNQAIARDIIASDLTVFDNYLSFLNALGDQYILAQAGVSDCPCDITWISTLDFKLSSYGFLFTPDDGLNPSGAWVNGVGLVDADVIIAGTQRRQLQGDLPFDVSTVTDISSSGTFTRGTASGGNSIALNQVLKLLGSNVGGTQVTKPQTDFTIGIATPYAIASPSFNAQGDEIRIRNLCSATNFSGDTVLEFMTIQGTGIKPPQLP